jgi:hypothetical protein
VHCTTRLRARGQVDAAATAAASDATEQPFALERGRPLALQRRCLEVLGLQPDAYAQCAAAQVALNREECLQDQTSATELRSRWGGVGDSEPGRVRANRRIAHDFNQYFKNKKSNCFLFLKMKNALTVSRRQQGKSVETRLSGLKSRPRVPRRAVAPIACTGGDAGRREAGTPRTRRLTRRGVGRRVHLFTTRVELFVSVALCGAEPCRRPWRFRGSPRRSRRRRRRRR